MYSIFLGISFPGWVHYDDCITAIEIFKGRAWAWQSTTYSMVLGIGYMLLGTIGFAAILSTVYFLYLVLIVIKIIDASKASNKLKFFAAFLLFLFSLWPTNQGLILSHYRDTLFSLMLCHIGMLLIQIKNWKKRDIVFVSLLIVVMGDLRQDAKVYLLLVPILCTFFKLWRWSEVKIYFLTVALAAPFYYYNLNSIFNVRTYTNDYKVTAYINPLSAIFHKKGIGAIDPSDVSTIHKVLDTDKLVKHYNPLDIDPFHQGAFNYKTSEQEWADFTKVSHKLFIENYEMFLDSRISLFKSMLNIDQRILVISDEFRSENSRVGEFYEKLNLTPPAFQLSYVGQKYYQQLNEFIGKRSFLWMFFNSLLTPLIYLLLVCLLAYKFKSIYIFAILILSRLPIMFLLAPAAYYKYLYSLELFFIFSLPLLIIFYFEKFRSKQEQDSF